MVITDLDGTLARPDGTICLRDVETLRELGARGVLRVVATGRSPHATRRLLAPDFPIDYLVFSCGAGVLDWATGEILIRHELDAATAAETAAILLGARVDFMIHDPIPENHRYRYFGTGASNPDFTARITRHGDTCRPWDGKSEVGAVSQFLVVDPRAHSGRLFERLRVLLPGLSLIRSTSPLDHQSAWIEIFSPNVNKGLAAEWLATRRNQRRERVMAVGNDYNDVDLLAWAGFPYVVANAPLQLRNRFREVASNAGNGFSEAVTHWLRERGYYY